MLITSAFTKENSAICLEEWVLVFKVFTTATRRLRVNYSHLCFRVGTLSGDSCSPFLVLPFPFSAFSSFFCLFGNGGVGSAKSSETHT